MRYMAAAVTDAGIVKKSIRIVSLLKLHRHQQVRCVWQLYVMV